MIAEPALFELRRSSELGRYGVGDSGTRIVAKRWPDGAGVLGDGGGDGDASASNDMERSVLAGQRRAGGFIGSVAMLLFNEAPSELSTSSESSSSDAGRLLCAESGGGGAGRAGGGARMHADERRRAGRDVSLSMRNSLLKSSVSVPDVRPSELVRGITPTMPRGDDVDELAASPSLANNVKLCDERADTRRGGDIARNIPDADDFARPRRGGERLLELAARMAPLLNKLFVLSLLSPLLLLLLLSLFLLPANASSL
mmetsp:Transcript_12905/g.22013  ORF Transcript_12905/g.22013 Transcript_12905/m.22013 type:complete len:257 (-) Transcript_12905:13-783(-)